MKAREGRKLSFTTLAEAVGRSEIRTAALFYGQAQTTPKEAAKLISLLGVMTGKVQERDFFEAPGRQDAEARLTEGAKEDPGK